MAHEKRSGRSSSSEGTTVGLDHHLVITIHGEIIRRIAEPTTEAGCRMKMRLPSCRQLYQSPVLLTASKAFNLY